MRCGRLVRDDGKCIVLQFIRRPEAFPAHIAALHPLGECHGVREVVLSSADGSNEYSRAEGRAWVSTGRVGRW